MFIGHFGLGYAARRVAPGMSLAWLFVAAQFADVLWPMLVVAGIEQVRIDPGNTVVTPLDFVSYPYSHSLLLLVGWGVLVAWVSTRSATATTTAVVMACLVVSHWVLDAVTHRPDMPLYPGGPKVGLGLWNSAPATIVVEGAIFAAGLGLYLRSTRAIDRIGSWGTWSLAVVLVLLYVANILSPPPPSIAAVAGAGLAGAALLVLWAWWTDLHRVASVADTPAPRHN